MFRDADLIPKLGLSIPAAERAEFEKAEFEILQAMSNCLCDLGKAITIMAWSKVHSLSDDIFDRYGFVPQMIFWGRAGKGKTTWLNWLLAFWGLTDKQGMFSYSTIKSGVGFNRKLAYYASLPLVVDELRADEKLQSFSNRVRELFNRSPMTQPVNVLHRSGHLLLHRIVFLQYQTSHIFFRHSVICYHAYHIFSAVIVMKQ